MNTILFDLDGTLLPIDMQLFEKIYFQELCLYFKDLLPSDKLIKFIWDSIKSMVQNLENKTNEKVFFESFREKVNDDITIFENRFNEFYDSNFHKVKEAVKDIPAIRESIKILKDKGYNLVIATNPLFPKKAIYYRIEWAGLNPEDFIYITTFEKNHYCKPQLLYYEEILKDIKKLPEECLMVGNDVQEDLVAAKLGIKTYLITDNILNRGKDKIISDYIGNYEDFLKFVKKLPRI